MTPLTGSPPLSRTSTKRPSSQPAPQSASNNVGGSQAAPHNTTTATIKMRPRKRFIMTVPPVSTLTCSVQSHAGQCSITAVNDDRDLNAGPGLAVCRRADPSLAQTKTKAQGVPPPPAKTRHPVTDDLHAAQHATQRAAMTPRLPPRQRRLDRDLSNVLTGRVVIFRRAHGLTAVARWRTMGLRRVTAGSPRGLLGCIWDPSVE